MPPPLHSFLVAWRNLYHSQPTREYDPSWLWDMFKIYWNFLIKILGQGHELLQVNKRQWQCYEMVIKKPESLVHRSRRAGKTQLLSHCAVFFAELGFGPCKGKVVYRCPHVNQLKGLKQWIKLNPFFIKFRKSEYEIELFECPHAVDAACISDSTSTGLECSVLLEDEYSTIKKTEDLYQQMLDSRAFLAKGATIAKRHIHVSSGRKNSPFEDDYNYLSVADPGAVHVMPYRECSWITEEFIEKERKKNFDCAYWIEEQYECMWVLASGQFFNQSHLHIVEDDFFTQHGIVPRSAGLDWNGEAVGHILYTTLRHDNNLFIFREEKLKEVQEVKKWTECHEGISLEVEGKPLKDGYNAGFSDHLQSLGCNCSYQGWTATDRTKDNRLAELQRSEVYVHSSCRWFIKNYKEAAYDPKGDKDGRPKLLKTPDQHGLDAVLHADHNGSSLDVVNDYTMYQENYVQDMSDVIRMHSRI